MFRSLLPPLLSVGLAAIGLVGGPLWFGRDRPDPGKRGGQVLGIVSTSRIVSLHPHQAAAPGTALMRTRIIQALREGLVEFDPRTQSPRAAAAQSWEFSADKRTAVFHLWPDLQWNNGDSLGADDFAFAFRLALANHSPAAESLFILKNARAFSEGRISDPLQVGVAALDAHTLRIELENPVPGLLVELCDIAWLPLHVGSAAALADGDYWAHPELLVTNGAFELAGATADVVTLTPNPRYRARGEVEPRRIEIHFTEDVALYPRLLQSGQAQMSDRLPSGDIDGPLPAGVQLWRDPSLAAGYVHFNVRQGPLADIRVRQALSLALDRAALAREVSSANVRPAYTCLPPVGEWESMHTVEENLEAARRLLAEAGYPGGRGLPVLRWPYRRGAIDASTRLPEACASQWRDRLGIGIYVLPLDDEDFQLRLAGRDYDVVLAAILGTLPDLSRIASQLCNARIRAYTGWDGGGVTQFVELARSAGPSELTGRLLEVEHQFLAEMPATPVIFYNRHMLKDVSIGGWYPDPTGLHPFKNLRLAAAGDLDHAD